MPSHYAGDHDRTVKEIRADLHTEASPMPPRSRAVKRLRTRGASDGILVLGLRVDALPGKSSRVRGASRGEFGWAIAEM